MIRMAPTEGPNNMNVSASAAGFNAGEANIIVTAGASRDEFSYTAAKMGATQHEQSINGAPAKPARNWLTAERVEKILFQMSGETYARTAALIRMPNTKAGQITTR
jgi:hypothetical protein